MEKDYWESRYTGGGTSGEGSIGIQREWKWRVITSFLPHIDHVIDVGCGNLSFWEGRDCSDYVGIDISETVIAQNRIRHPKWTFYSSAAENLIPDIKRSCVFCFDLLFHIMNDEVFIKILNNLCLYSTDYIFIYTWMENPFTKKFWFQKFLSALIRFDFTGGGLALRNTFSKQVYTDKVYQYFRSILQYMHIFRQHSFDLVDEMRNPDDFGGMYIFRHEMV